MTERILVVDDEEGNQELLEAILEEQGFVVEHATDGAQALALATAAPPDLILLDLVMPRMNGVEVCRRLKRQSSTAAVPILVVTAVGHVGTKQAALMSGADDFVTKPFRPADLRARVTAMLKVRQIDAELDRTLAYLHEVEAGRYAQRQGPLMEEPVGLSPGESPGSRPIPILLVDDEALTRAFYGDLLTQHGFHVHTASSGAEGLELAREHPIETAILDIVMPEMSGLEVLERLHDAKPTLPVVMLTGRPTAQNAIAALKLGAFDFLVKGLDHNLVVMTVHRAVRHRREICKQQEELAQLRARIAELEHARADG